MPAIDRPLSDCRYNSGAPNVTDGFVSAFWYLDNMALLAAVGYRAFCRQVRKE